MLLSLPDTWNYSVRGLSSITPDGVDGVLTALKELERLGYLERNQQRESNGRMGRAEYVIYEMPRKKPCLESPCTEKPYTVRHGLGTAAGTVFADICGSGHDAGIVGYYLCYRVWPNGGNISHTRSQVQTRLQSIFEAQYELKLEEKVEIRTRKETRVGYRYNPITGTGHTYTYQVTVQYEYKILNVTLLNRGVDYVARNSGLTDDQLQRYEVTLECRGNRDDLFAGIAFATPDGAGSSGEYQDYDIPGEALTDEKFRKMITEAEKYLGYPYVWGGSSPSTSFDCSGFVSWMQSIARQNQKCRIGLWHRRLCRKS